MDEQSDVIRAPIPSELITFGIATVSVDGQDIVILSEGDGYRAIDRWCPHEDGDLGEGIVFGKHIKCPVHGYIFELAKGQCLNHLNMRARVYEVELGQEEIVLRPLA
jgi:nitrite reductase/ring-hydroxylating ferredoxin subunit